MASPTMASGGGDVPVPTLSRSDNFFAQTGTDYTYTGSYDMCLNPSSTIENHMLTFDMPKLSSPNVAFLNDLVVQLTVKLQDKDGNKCPDDSITAPVNLFPSAMFRSCALYLNETRVSSTEVNTYPLRCYTDLHMNNGFSPKHGRLQMYGYYPDRPHQFQRFASTAIGFTQRRQLFARPAPGTQPGHPVWKYTGNAVSVYSKLFTDFNDCPLPIPSDVALRVELLMNPPSFYITCGDADADAKQYRLHIESATLQVPCKVMNSSMALALEKRMAESPLKYPLRRIESKKLVIPASQQSFVSDTLVQSSVLPDRLLLAMIKSEYWEGGYKHNPFQMDCTFVQDSEIVNLTRSSLTLNGAPVETVITNSHDQLILAAYRQMFKNLGQLDTTDDCYTELRAFEGEGGYFMLLYDLTQDGRAANKGARHPVRSGNLRLELQFDKVLPASVNLFVLAEYHSSCEIGKSRSIQYNFIA